ncbi:hypothetical protein [Cellvibrio japonicus]|uniref:Uncharacterized protein n=1 Tax=Cellvibrio japonicus (strain Ueda107) TaxID=498211 RepID=B3PBP8_CELJU|nr:hypothetical protein [Cellvibrio japonicus]ACE86324.1 hypothetical protein CJA_1112 [Cellvibrio japonicus Ueda107]QEI11720.1 hypothetical protein FY117_05400 [Cellvibrio japonicus]QEI15294.1 hypothetical protein FY116_05400 [Cellvibrio japonicus]QEI18874.1 hypothetical protein FY115_05400 [Cellvibrio japonicus]
MQTQAHAPAESSGQHLPHQQSTPLSTQPQASFDDARPLISQLKAAQAGMGASLHNRGLQSLQAKMVSGSSLQMKKAAATGSSSPVVQMGGWEWPSWLPWGKKKEDPYKDLSPQDRRLAQITDSIHEDERAADQLRRHGQHVDHEGLSNVGRLHAHRARVRDAADTPTSRTLLEKVDSVGGAGSFVGGQAVTLGNLLGDDKLGFGGAVTKASGEGVGVVGSLINAGIGIHDIATSKEQRGDKAIKGVGVAGSLASAAQSGASGLGTVSGLLPNVGGLSSVAGAASSVIAPAAIAKSGADVITGLATGGLAHYRSNKLAAMQNDYGNSQHGIAKYASDNQWTKAKANYGKAFGGALGVAGGAVLLAAGLSNPIGWGLLGGAAVVGLGLAAYKAYKKHQMGKKLKEDGNYRGMLAGNHIVVPDQVPRQGFGDYFKTESMRRNENVRGQIATHLAQSEGRRYSDDEPNESAQIVNYLGVKEARKASAFDRLLSGGDDEQQRAKAIAKGLDF